MQFLRIDMEETGAKNLIGNFTGDKGLGWPGSP